MGNFIFAVSAQILVYMNNFGLGKERHKEVNRRRLQLVLVSASAAVVFGFCVYGVVYSFDIPRNFLNKTAALLGETFHDVLGSGGGKKLAAEIDLGGGPQSSAPVPVISETVPSGVGENYAGTEIVSSPQVSSGEGSVTPSRANGKLSSISSPESAVAQTSSTELAKTTFASAAVVCDFTGGAAPSREVVFNEVAWMGSVPQAGETATQAANNEWLELRNISRNDVDLSGWQILNDTGKFKIVFAAGEKLSAGGSTMLTAGGFYLLERADDDSVPGIRANKIYSGALSNSGMNLRILDAQCAVIDEVGASFGWPAGDNSTKVTMERNAGDFGWHTSAAPGGTPKAENSTPIAAIIVTTTSVPTASNATTTTSTVVLALPNHYSVGVSFQGGGSGMIISSPAGIYCGTDCMESYISGTLLTLAATPDSNSEFTGWSGPCSGTGVCVFAVNDTESVVSTFKSLVPISSPAPSSGENQGGQTPSSTPPAPAVGGMVISEIMAGTDGNTDYEFVELYNPTSNQIDLTSWTIKKKSSTGTESSLLVASRMSGKSIGANKYFLAVNEGGYTGSVTPDVSWAHSNTIAYTNNAVILYDASGTKIEEVNWAEIPAGKSYARASWGSSSFVVQDVPTPQNSAGY